MASSDEQVETLERAYEALARRVVADRLAFADRVQEELDALADRDRQIEQLTTDLEQVRARVESLHAELQEAHADLFRIRSSRLYRLASTFRRSGRPPA